MQNTRSTKLLTAAVVAAGFALGLAACGGSESDGTSKPAAKPAAGNTQGAALFKQRCSVCHGNTGHGDGMGAAALNPKPRNLTTEPYKFVDIAGSANEVEALTKYITGGHIESGMPPYVDLAVGVAEPQRQTEVKAIAEFVASIRPKPNFVEAPAETPAEAPAEKPAEKPADSGG
ncbi:MAG: cytochrome c [Phycisphaerales bacterium]|nr:cytochrome c [Phycisphaerales bacterium]